MRAEQRDQLFAARDLDGGGRCARGHLLRQVIERDACAGRDRRGGGERLVELADVERPAIAAHRPRGGGREAEVRGGRVARERGGDERAEIFDAVAQRWQRGAQAGEAGVEIDAEATGLDLALEILVRRGDEAHVDWLRRRLADRDDLAFLEHAQQRALRREREVGDLVEQQRAAVGAADRARAIIHRAGVRAAAVAEQRCRGERLDETRAVDRDEICPVRPESSWIMRAATSLPTPLSPSSSTETVEGAMSARRRSACSTVGTTESEPVASSGVEGETLSVRKRRNVSPISIQSPSSRTLCARRSPLTERPFLLPRSRTCQPPSDRSTTACSTERCGSGSPRRSVASARARKRIALAAEDRALDAA